MTGSPASNVTFLSGQPPVGGLDGPVGGAGRGQGRVRPQPDRPVVRSHAGVVALVASVLLVACAGRGTSSAPTTIAASTKTTLSQVELDRAKAARSVLSAVDVPGYAVRAKGAGGETAKVDADACVKGSPVLLRLGKDDDQRGAKSENFVKGQDLGVGSSASFAETPEEAGAAVAALMAPSFPGCLAQVITAGLRTEGTMTNIAVTTSRLPALTAGDQSVGYRSVAKGAISEQAVVLNIDYTFVRVGRSLASIRELSLGSPFPESERLRLATAIAARMAGP